MSSYARASSVQSVLTEVHVCYDVRAPSVAYTSTLTLHSTQVLFLTLHCKIFQALGARDSLFLAN